MTTERIDVITAVLIAAAKAAVESDGGTSYLDGADDIGHRACCKVLSYKYHTEDCWVPRLRAALARAGAAP